MTFVQPQLCRTCLRNQPYFKDAGPEFAGDEQALSLGIVSDAVQHRILFNPIDWTQKTGEINPAEHLPVLRGDAGDPIGLPYIGVNLAVHELQFIQFGDRITAIVDLQTLFLFESAAVKDADLRCSIA